MNMWKYRYRNVTFLSRLCFRKPLLLLGLLAEYARVVVLRQRRLRTIDVAVDYRCNMECTHCSSRILLREEDKQIGLSEYERLARELRREGCLVFHFTGGEPFLRDDLVEIIGAFKPHRSIISIQTNGLLVTRERLRALRDAGLDILCVSVDSGNPEEHDAFRRSPGSHGRALAAVELALSLGLRAMVSTCVTHDNLDSEGLRKIIAYAGRMGVWCYFNLAVPIGNWRENTDVLFQDDDRRKMERLISAHPHCRTDFYSNWLRYGCGAVKEKLYLTPYGEIMPCPFIQISLGNMRQEPLEAIRRRALAVPEFRSYHPVCLAAEDQAFIAKCPCYSNSSEPPPVSWESLSWFRKEIDPCRE